MSAMRGEAERSLSLALSVNLADSVVTASNHFPFVGVGLGLHVVLGYSGSVGSRGFAWEEGSQS